MNLESKTTLHTSTIDNPMASLTIDAFGGALVDFHLRESKINPLTFRFTKDQMPVNNKSGAPYQGHFLCLGRWGEPSVGEKKAGIPDHGHFANTLWTCSLSEGGSLKMHAESGLEGLKIDRSIQMDEHVGLYMVSETVMNIHSLGRLYNMVQHPTLAPPFLNNSTTIQCNALKGFHYKNYADPESNASDWPYGIEKDKTIRDLRFCVEGTSSVFCFIINDHSRYGWITAYSPDAQLLIGYLWLRNDYPWINVWKDWDNGNIKYCGLEFGTTGIHQPFAEILKQQKAKVFGNDCLKYIDAGESVCRKYISFLVQTPDDFDETVSVDVDDRSIQIKGHNNPPITLHSDLIRAW
ncbi:MAG: hypothetical protein ABIR06_20425 [Cyclobacteriaceae bacterium]